MARPDAAERAQAQELNRLIRERKLDVALTRCEALLSERPESPWLRCCRAEILLKSGDTQRAGRVLQPLVAEYPDHPRVLALAGERHRLEGRDEEAVRCYAQSLLRRENAFTRVRLIDTLLRLGRTDEALRETEFGLKRHPRDPYLLRRRARLLAALNRPEDAADTYAQAARLSRSGYHDQAEAIRLRLQNIPKAERRKELRALLQVGPHDRNPYLHALAAELDLEAGEVATAQERLDQAARLAEGDPAALKRIGYLFNRLGAHARVLDTLGQAFVEHPRDVVAQQVLFAAARKTGNLTRLRTILTLAYDRHPGFHKLNGLIRKVDKELQRGES